MAWNPNFKKGVDGPIWEWLAQFPLGAANPGSANAYDGVRFIYWAIQYGSTGGVSTTQLFRYDTWLDGWQYLATLTSAFNGLDVEYDMARNLVYVTAGNGATSWQVFNLNTTAVTVANQSIGAWSLATVTLVLPAAANTGSSLAMPDDFSSNGSGVNPIAIDTGNSVAAGSTSTSLVSSPLPGTFAQGMVGLQVRMVTGALAGQVRTISGVTSPTTLATAAFTAAPAVGDTFVVEVPQETASGGSTTTLVNAAVTNWAVNQYANSDVVILSGTGAGQRRRIASNTATTLTLSGAVAGNPRTGPFTIAPDATSVYRIVPSSDFLYYTPANASTAMWRLDVVATTGTAWVAVAALPAGPAGGANLMYPQSYAPFQLLCARGAGTQNIYAYNIGLNNWNTLTTYWGPNEVVNTGASICMIHGRRKMWISIAGSTRVVILDLTTGIVEPGPLEPYANPGAYDGHRARYIKTADGVEYIYHMRPGGQELWRIALEWMV